MRKARIYQLPRFEGRETFVQEWASGNDSRRANALVSVVLGSGDPILALECIHQAAIAIDPQLKQLAVVCTGHWFRPFGAEFSTAPEKLREILGVGLATLAPPGVVEDMRSELQIFAPHFDKIVERSLHLTTSSDNTSE